MFSSFSYVAWNDVYEFCKSLGADVESGRHIRRLISNWNKIKNKHQSENSQSPNQYVSESWQLLEQIFSEKMAAASNIDESEPVEMPVSKLENPKNNGEGPISAPSQKKSDLTTHKTVRKRQWFNPMDETQRTEILKYVRENKNSLYREDPMGRPNNEMIIGWNKVYELAMSLNADVKNGAHIRRLIGKKYALKKYDRFTFTKFLLQR